MASGPLESRKQGIQTVTLSASGSMAFPLFYRDKGGVPPSTSIMHEIAVKSGPQTHCRH
jgi:hypothetical protein